MKANLMQVVASSVMLGLMAGAVGLHWYQVDQWTAVTDGDSKENYVPVRAGELNAMAVSLTDDGLFAETPESSSLEPAAGRREMDATVTALNEIVSVLRDLKDENKNLKEQVQEANRDLNEMRFQIDTHSASFRPLKVRSESVPTGLLEVPESHPLLPPKRQH